MIALQMSDCQTGMLDVHLEGVSRQGQAASGVPAIRWLRKPRRWMAIEVSRMRIGEAAQGGRMMEGRVMYL